MTDSLTLNEDAQYIIQRTLAGIDGYYLVSHIAMLPKYVDDNHHHYAEKAEELIKSITRH